MLDVLNQWIALANEYLWGWPMIILLLGTHIYMTIRLRFPQRFVSKAIRLSLTKDKDGRGDVSQFGALATSLAATIGTGNIVGVATAVALGGPGAVFWCWLTGLFGISTKYAEGLLAVKYRIRTEDGHMAGGPMYALERGLGWRWAAILFAFFTAVASFGIGNMVQGNAISTLCYNTYEIPAYITAFGISAVTALVLLFGLKGISRVCSMFVPFMALLYVLGCIYILIVNGVYVWDALCLIIKSAFSPEAAGGGFVGTTIIMSARYGIARGLFSNESGMGSAPIVAAAAQTRNPVRQALVSSSATFWDTVVICALTGLVIVSSILAYPEISHEDGGALTQVAFGKIPYIGAPLLTFGIITFAFSTIIGWSYYGEKGAEYLGGPRLRLPYRVIYVVMVFVGAMVKLDFVWNVSDLLNAFMAIPNLLSVLLLSAVVAGETKRYLWSDRLDDYPINEYDNYDKQQVM
ncbi:MAG: sodium:alanine symporter family protein [Bacteroidaceae bacterium]|nr:sodium:alanine symporter family protein [Bacteroidaceae bacterium]